MNAGKDVHTLMREITLPAELEVGQGYGKVPWDVRAIWENYSGWFHHRSTAELYDDRPRRTQRRSARPRRRRPSSSTGPKHTSAPGQPVHAIHLAEIVTHAEPEHTRGQAVLKAAHEDLLEASTNFWESAWLTKQIRRLLMTDARALRLHRHDRAVTGGTSGIGHATALLFRDAGAHGDVTGTKAGPRTTTPT